MTSPYRFLAVDCTLFVFVNFSIDTDVSAAFEILMLEIVNIKTVADSDGERE